MLLSNYNIIHYRIICQRLRRGWRRDRIGGRIASPAGAGHTGPPEPVQLLPGRQQAITVTLRPLLRPKAFPHSPRLWAVPLSRREPDPVGRLHPALPLAGRTPRQPRPMSLIPRARRPSQPGDLPRVGERDHVFGLAVDPCHAGRSVGPAIALEVQQPLPPWVEVGQEGGGQRGGG